MSRECTTHHYACDCREKKFRDLLLLVNEVISWDEDAIANGLVREDAGVFACDIRKLREFAEPMLKEAGIE